MMDDIISIISLIAFIVMGVYLNRRNVAEEIRKNNNFDSSIIDWDYIFTMSREIHTDDPRAIKIEIPFYINKYQSNFTIGIIDFIDSNPTLKYNNLNYYISKKEEIRKPLTISGFLFGSPTNVPTYLITALINPNFSHQITNNINGNQNNFNGDNVNYFDDAYNYQNNIQNVSMEFLNNSNVSNVDRETIAPLLAHLNDDLTNTEQNTLTDKIYKYISIVPSAKVLYDLVISILK